MIESVELGSVCEFINGDRGKNYPSQGSFLNIGIPFINAGDLSNKLISISKLNYISVETYDKLGSGKIKIGDILFCLRGSLGKIGVNTQFERGAIASSLVIIRAGKKIDQSYLAHYLNSDNCQRLVIKSDNGTTQPNLSASNVKKFKIPLPQLQIQQKIAAILDKADNLHQFNKQLIAKYNELSHSLFLDMFGDPIRNTNGWEVKRLEELSTQIGSGNTPKGGSKIYVEKGIAFFRSQNVWKNRLELDDVAYIDEGTHQNMRKSSLKNGDILMTKTGRVNTENSSLGRAAMYLGEDDKANLNGHVYLIRLQKHVINEFILFILTTNEYREHIRRVCVGGIDKRQLNKDHLEDFPIIWPPLKLQQKFVERLRAVERLKKDTQRSLDKSEELFNCLLQRAFKGELVS
ncbi:restriction endonuclease subunit S [Reichenbachiella sp.]|uniref:restriction endonuclease subunit S n=1 Tax=Reichenbachiella sp. TaxID=2184521 RepID=UPI003B5CA793